MDIEKDKFWEPSKTPVNWLLLEDVMKLTMLD